MSGGKSVQHIDAVDAFARNLFLRVQATQRAAAGSPSPRLEDVANAVKQLHLALRHLRIEASDPDSLLNINDVPSDAGSGSESLFARQLKPIVEDCGFALKQLETVLDRLHVEDGATDGRIAAISAKLMNEKTHIDMFLNTVQLHNPATKPDGGAFDASSQGTLENIKDQVDAIATSLFARRKGSGNGGLSDDENSLWKEFKTELESAGFSPDVLRKHKDVLRAYIRELESMSQANGGAPPTVRGLLEQEAKSIAIPSPPKEMMFPIENEKCFPSMKQERRMPNHAPMPPTSNSLQLPPRLDVQSHSSDDGDSVASDTMALISTRDLVAMDTLNASMASMQLQRPGQNYGTASPRSNQKYLPTSHTPGALMPPPSVAELPGSPSKQLEASPRFAPHLPPYSSPVLGNSPRRVSHLAPDRWGQEIPMDALWTRIKRTLVSPEVLERAGVRYEARPEFVAVLGQLSREQISEFARQSADARAARSGRRPSPKKPERYHRESQDSKSSRSEEEDDESVLWDESDTTDSEDDRTSDKGTKSYPYIVSPPEKGKSSPSSTVKPKPILKNKNENHVRFDPEPYEVEGKSPRSLKDDRDHDRRRDYHSRRHHRDRDDRHDRRDRRNGERDRDRHRSWDSEYHRGSNGHHRDRRSDRRDDHRDDRANREDRSMKKKSLGETLGAVSLGGAAVSLLSVLAEAATGF